MSIILENGKYEFYTDGASVACRRHGEAWRVFVGDKAVGALFDYAKELEVAIVSMRHKLQLACPHREFVLEGEAPECIFCGILDMDGSKQEAGRGTP